MTDDVPEPSLGDLLVEKLKASAVPMTLKEASKGVPKRKKDKPADLEARVRAALEAEAGPARVFVQPSGKAGAVRYWARDERHRLCERAVELAAKPQTLPALTKAVAKETKADTGYVEGLLRDLIRDNLLHEHLAKKGPLFGAVPPPPPTPPLELPANAKELAKLAVSVEKLMKKAGVDAEAVLAALRGRMTVPVVPPLTVTEVPPPTPIRPPHPPRTDVPIERAILAALARETVMSLADLRQELPVALRGEVFDEAVLRLSDEERVILHRDADPLGFSDAQRAEYVQDGPALFTTIAKRG